MGHLVVFAESGVPHSGCILQYGGTVEWLSFMPRATSIWDTFPGGNYGMVDTTDREGAIDSYVSMWVDDDALVKGRNTTLADYYSATYGLFINDCLSFSRDMVKNCKLGGGSATSFLPSVYVTQLYPINKDRVQSYNSTPYLWKSWSKNK